MAGACTKTLPQITHTMSLISKTRVTLVWLRPCADNLIKLACHTCRAATPAPQRLPLGSMHRCVATALPHVCVDCYLYGIVPPPLPQEPLALVRTDRDPIAAGVQSPQCVATKRPSTARFAHTTGRVTVLTDGPYGPPNATEKLSPASAARPSWLVTPSKQRTEFVRALRGGLPAGGCMPRGPSARSPAALWP